MLLCEEEHFYILFVFDQGAGVFPEQVLCVLFTILFTDKLVAGEKVWGAFPQIVGIGGDKMHLFRF
jgi:hypothetical protein